jgi:hypothetical protein
VTGALIGSLGFAAPWLLLGLVALPILWWLLRAIPPAPLRRLFPAVVLLLGLKDPESTPVRTPWWLLALRVLAVAALIVGFAGPILNPKDAGRSNGPLLILIDAGWASAPDWAVRLDRAGLLVDEAGRDGRPVALVALADALPDIGPLPFRAASDWSADIGGLQPRAWDPDYVDFADWLDRHDDASFDTIWLADGLARDGLDDLAAALAARGEVTVMAGDAVPLAITPPTYRDGRIVVEALRPGTAGDRALTLGAYGPDPSGIERRLAAFDTVLNDGADAVEVEFTLPADLRNRITRFQIDGQRSAGAVALADDSLKRRKVALIAGRQPREGQELVSPLYYLRKALAPTAELIEAPLDDVLLAKPDVIVMADVASLTPDETERVVAWVEQGGLVLRFAGPRLAASTLGRTEDDPLLPVRLRAGGRNVGGAMSWGAPRSLMPFEKDTPFFGLEIPDDVSVTSQVIAQPGPELAQAVIAALQDGTPLVTRVERGEGQVVLFHVTANAEWSSLPLSGLFVQMLDRLAVSTATAAPVAADLAGQVWQPDRVLTGFGDLADADTLPGVAGEDLADGMPGPGLRPGLYRNGQRAIAVNTIVADRRLAPAAWPDGVTVVDLATDEEQPLKAILLLVALGLLAGDILATLWLTGRLSGPRGGIVAPLLAGLLILAPEARAADDDLAILATRDTVLAYVKTGDSRLDATSEAGLRGLSRMLAVRTAVEPVPPIAVDLETDELAFFPMIYWPITERQPRLSEAAYARLNAYLRTGGMILFDTADADLGGFGTTPNGRKLREIAAPLDIPALEPVPADHVLTRAFYLLQDFPGRYARSDIWVEAGPADATRAEGMPFRNLNDGVSPVVIGGNDWASAWAVTASGDYMYPVGRGFAGERQREIAYRFGINLVMYVLTGNYKSDQVHVPALLERLGQ